jgi:hypothetical protein
MRHAKDIWACDFFSVRTIFFQTLYVFFVMQHETRRILQVRVSQHPTAAWAAQQVVDACGWDRDPPRYLIRDRDGRFGIEFDRRVPAAAPAPTAYSSGQGHTCRLTYESRRAICRPEAADAGGVSRED